MGCDYQCFSVDAAFCFEAQFDAMRIDFFQLF